MEAGNNLEQSVALVAAANKVVQDPNSVGSALRTISLRLRGTSVEVLEEMGEETDGVVESVSKMQEKIKALTGVDILTDSGAYKDTYTILYEIGKVWNGLENLDKSALLELMAGKNRANTLAAILNNMKDLKGAYEAALNADGSALQENLTYLDSIDGKIKLVTNSIQTMWMNLLDSTVLKFLLDVANGLIKIADKIGVINTAVSAFAGFRAFSSKNTFGNTFKLDKESGFGLNEDSFGGQAIKGIGSLINKIFNKDSIDDYTGAINTASDATKNATDNVIYLSSAQQGQQAAAAGAQAANLGAAGSTQALGISSKVAAVGVQLLNSALSMGIAFLASVAIQAFVKGMYNLAHAEEQAADRATDAVNAYRSANKELKDQKITIDELASDYERLSSGVNTATNTNIGLTTEAYEEYLDVCNDIADMYPELIVGYDAQGNAIIDLKGNVEALTRAYENAERAAASLLLTPDNKEDIWTDYNNSVNEDVKKQWWGSWMPSGTIQEQQEILDHFTKMTNEDFAALLDASEDINNAWGSADRELGKNGRSFYNILSGSGYDGAYLDNGKLTSFLNDTGLDFEGIAKQIEDGDITLTEGINTLRLNVSTALSNTSATISTSMSKIQDAVSASLIFDPVYQGLDDKAKGIVQSLVGNIDPEMIAESGAQSADEFIKYFSEHIITGIRDNQGLFNDLTSVSDKIAEAMSDGNKTDFDAATAEFKTLIAEWIGEDGEIIINPDADVATQYLQRLAQSIGEQSKNFEVKLQFKEEYESSLGALQPETSGETYQDKQQEAKEIVSHYENIMAEANELGIDTNKTVFGNIDTNNRHVLQWTKENAELYKNAIESWGESVDDYLGAYSTVDGKSMNIDGIEIAFSPMLQTDSGAVYLDKNTVDAYFSGLFEGLGEDWATEDLLALDAEGLEVDGRHIKGLIADIGDTAIETGAAMHFTGNTGAIVDGWSQIEVAAAAAGISAERYVQAVKNGDWNALGIDIPEAPPVLTASELLDGTDAKTYIENARKMSKESGVLAEAQNAMITALAGEDGVLYSDEMTEMYDAWAKAGNKVPEGADWTDDQIAGIQILDELINQYNTDIDTVKQSLIELGLIAPSLADIGVFDFKSESTQELISKFESDIASIKETWNSLNDGEMTKSDFIEWAMEFPEAIEGVDLSSDNWMVQAKENAEKLYKTVFDGEDGFITSLTKQREAMAAQGKDTTEVDKWIAYATQIQSMPLLDAVQDKTVPNTISNLEAAYENYKTILEETNEVLYDGQKVSEDYYESLKEYIDDVEALDSCFDKNNKQIITNAKKLKDLIKQQKQETANLSKIARAQSQLQYQDLVQDLIRATFEYERNTDAGYDEIESLLEQIDVVRDTIEQYKRLELSLFGATSAYEEFQKAQQIDQDTDYESQTINILEAIGSGFDTGKVGLEAFNAGIKAIFSESVYGDLSDVEDLDAVWDAFTGANLELTNGANIANLFNWSKDDGFTITIDNIKSFIEQAEKLGVFAEGSTFEDFSLKTGTYLKDVAEAFGLSEEAAYAYLEILSDYSIGGGSLVDELADVQFDVAIENATDNLAELAEKKAEMLKSGQYDPTDMQQLNADIEKAQETLENANKEAIDHANKYTTLAALNSGLSNGISMTREQLDSLASRLSQITGEKYTINADGTQLIDVNGNVVNIQNKLKELGAQPTILEVQLAANSIQAELDDLNAQKELISKNPFKASLELGVSQADLPKELAKIEEQIKGYEAQLGVLEVQYGLKPVGEGETSIIEKFSTWESNGINTTVNLDTTKANADANALNEKVSKPETKTVTVNTVQGTTTATTTGGSATIDFKVGGGYQTALDAIAELSARCATPIDQLVEVDDNGTIEVIQGDLETLNKYKLENKYLTASISGYTGILSQLNTIISKLHTIDNINAVATISVEGSGSLALGTNPGPVKPNSNSKYVDYKKGQMNNTVFATGSPGLPNAEHGALVGELGPEAVVDPASGTWQTVGNFGAEFVDLPKGAIIFNHLQTQELLSRGHTTRGKMVNGSAFAGGRAFANESLYDKQVDWTENGNPFNNDVNDNNGVGKEAEEFAECIDGIAIKLEELEEAIGLLSAELENAADYSSKNSKINEIIGKTQEKYATSLAGAAYYETHAAKYLGQLTSYYQQLAQYGEITIKDFADDIASGAITEEAASEIVENVNNYREYAQKAADLKQQAEEAIAEIRDLAIQRIDEAYESGKVRADVEDSQTEKLQNRVDLHEEQGLVTSEKYYLAMMENSNKKIEYLTSARKNMQKALDTAVRNGELIKGSNEWYEQINEIYGIDAEIAEATIELEEFQNAINDIYWDNFENLTNQIEYLKDQTQSLIDLMEHSGDFVAEPEKKKYEGGTEEYWTAEDVKWTNEGLAALGLYAQQMEIAEFEAKQYAEAIDDLNAQYAAGRYSESEYLEKLEELTSAQYDSIEAYYEAQDAIIDLNKTRIDSIKNGIEKEIDAYAELIEKKKEELNAEKDLYDFQKSTMQQQKNIAEIERKLAALANDNSLSAASKRKQLEAELAEAQYELQDTYYNRSVEDKQTALDKELQDFQEEKNAELLKWEEYLTNVEVIVADSLNTIQANASIIYDTLNSKAQEYDLTLSDSILSPWRDGELAVSDYQNTFDTAMSSTMDQLDALKRKWQDVIDEMARAAQIDLSNINAENESYISANQQTSIRDTAPSIPVTRPPVNVDNTPSTDYGSDNSSGNITVGGKINAGNALIYASSSGTGGSQQYFKNDPIYTVVQEQNGFLLVRHHTASSGYTGWFRKSDVTAYAKGTVSAPQSGLVNIDELGEELIIRANNGRLSYMEKGSGVVPADLTSNLMEWGKLDPKSMIEQNRPSIAAPMVQNKEINLDITYGDILHIEQFNGDDPDEIAKIVAKQFEKHTKQLNSAIRKFAR